MSDPKERMYEELKKAFEDRARERARKVSEDRNRRKNNQ